MRRSPLKRKTPMRTTKGAKRGAAAGRTTRRTKSRSSRVRDEGYLKLVRSLECLAPPSNTWVRTTVGCIWVRACLGDVEAHHAGKRPGTGLKCSDYDTHPFCMKHHTDWHSGSGPFKGWTRQQRREWADEQIRLTRARLGR